MAALPQICARGVVGAADDPGTVVVVELGGVVVDVVVVDLGGAVVEVVELGDAVDVVVVDVFHGLAAAAPGAITMAIARAAVVHATSCRTPTRRQAPYDSLGVLMAPVSAYPNAT